MFDLNSIFLILRQEKYFFWFDSNKFIRCIKGKKQQTSSPHTSISPISTNITTTDAEPQNNILIDGNRQKEFVQWLQRDGVFLLHLLNSHAGERLTIKCVEDLLAIWINN